MGSDILRVMRPNKREFVQENLFGSKIQPERFRVDSTTNRILRTVSPDNPENESVTTEMGVWDASLGANDLRAAADLAYLKRAERPVRADLPPRGEVRLVDLFSGCGAMSLGVAEACRALALDFTPIAAVDVDERALSVYETNFGAVTQCLDLGEVLQADLTLDPTLEEERLIATLGVVDFVVGGPPCQGHSNLNNRTRRVDPKNQLYFLMARFAQLVNPKWMVVENVPTVLNDKSDVVARTQLALEELGYETVHGVVDMTRLGVPQTRKRHVLVARKRPAESDAGQSALPDLDTFIAGHYTRPRSVAWGIEDLLNAPNAGFMDRTKVPDPVTQSRIDYLFEHDLYDLPDSQRPDCHRSKQHSYSSVYGRMKWENPSPTITGGFETMGRGRFVHPKRRRTITAHEAARIQMIPDFFKFEGKDTTRTSVGAMIGNAVPPKLSYVLAVELLRRTTR